MVGTVTGPRPPRAALNTSAREALPVSELRGGTAQQPPRLGAFQALKLQPSGLLVQDTQHHALAVPGGDRGDAHVDRAAGDAQADATVLRQALLGDVQL